ncbi:eukaryotic translation initiation factor 3 subunit G-like, partial [Passer montanus]|uniref:eukaryotic translation initiation factor 3 subunit G-like n=1 Tax=Passer montanus TaxID=9160 RepID=UPI001961E827
RSSKPSWADQVEEEGGEDDKVITSELLKDLPLPGVLGGPNSAEAELLKGGPLPSPKEVVNGNIKTITEYREEEDGRKVKIIRTFRIETRKASKAVARRKVRENGDYGGDLNCQEEQDCGPKVTMVAPFWWPHRCCGGPVQKELAEQLGLSTGEKEKLPGEPEPVAAQVSKTGKYVPPSLRDGASRRGESMQPNRRGPELPGGAGPHEHLWDLNCQEEEDPMNKLKGQKIVSCRICKGDHWTTRCPYKCCGGPVQKELAEQLGLSTGEKEKLPGEPEPVAAQVSKTGKYVPPSLRDGASRRGESMQPNRRGEHLGTPGHT